MLMFEKKFNINEFVENIREMLINGKIMDKENALVGIVSIECKLYYLLAIGKQLFVTDGKTPTIPLEEMDCFGNQDIVKIINQQSPGPKIIKNPQGKIEYLIYVFPLSIK